MKKFSKMLLTSCLLATMMIGCSSGDSSSSSSSSSGSTGSTSGSSSSSSNTGSGANDTATDGAALDIAIVSSPSGVDDGSFNQNNYNGILAFVDENPASKVAAVREENEANAVPAVADIVAEYDAIICTGFQFSGITSIALENPDTYFILVDTEPANPDGSGDPIQVDNIYAMTFADEESGFFAGLAAALSSETKKVAVVNGVAFPSNVNYQFGFESGVNYANANYDAGVEIVELASYAGTDVTGTNVNGNYIGAFDDVAGGKVLGEALIAEGVDVIFVAAGGAGAGVFTAAKEGDVKVVGVDVDQYDDGANAGSNIVLTSALKIMDVNVYRQLNAIKDGTFVGHSDVLGADTDSTGYVKEDGRHQLTEETIEKMEDAYDLMKDGVIVPSSNFNGIESDDFPGMTQ